MKLPSKQRRLDVSRVSTSHLTQATQEAHNIARKLQRLRATKASSHVVTMMVERLHRAENHMSLIQGALKKENVG